MTDYKPFKDGTELKINVYYNKGGQNYFTGRTEQRGYYLSVSPVKRERIGNMITEQYTAFSGTKMLLKAVARQSVKAYDEAVALSEAKLPELINHVMNQN